MSDHVDIQAILIRYEDAIRRRDADAIVADYVDDAIGYDLAPPLVQGAPDAAGIREWFEIWEDDLRVTHRDVHILQDGDLAVHHCLQHMTGTAKDEGYISLWFRGTMALRRIDGAWKIAHIHTSVPMAMDAAARR